MNTDILTKAIFLFSCASDTDFVSECVNTANRQIDWVLGCSPFNASSCEGVGYNQQQLLINSGEFIPPVPQIPGGVQTGIGCIYGTDTPQLCFSPKGDATTEYNMPETSALLEALAAALMT